MGKTPMFAGLRKPCMDSSRHREHGILLDGYLQSMGFTKNETNPNLYYIFVGVDLLVLVLYVDDLFLTGA
jgi:hypothetical protein